MNKTIGVPPPVMLGDPLMVYTAARKIADLAIEVWREASERRLIQIEDRRKEAVNHCHNQTTGGLFVEQCYGAPGSIWTPWGEWDCWGAATGDETLMKEFLSRIGKVELAVPQERSYRGIIGPIYAVTQVGDIVLPKPEKREYRSYIEYDDARQLWAEVGARFKEGQK